MRKIIMLTALLLTVLLLAGCSQEEETPENDVDEPAHSESAQSGFATPEAAVTAYLEGLRNTDIDQMLSAFAIEVFIEHFDFEAFLGRLQAYHHTQQVRMPNANAFAQALNIEHRRVDIVRSIVWQYLALSRPDFDTMAFYPLPTEDDVAAFVGAFYQYLNVLDFGSLEVIGFIPAEELHELYLSEQNQENIARNAEFYGVNYLKSLAVLFELNGERYLFFVDAALYGDEWYLVQFGGNIAALLALSPLNWGIVFPEFVDEILAGANVIPPAE